MEPNSLQPMPSFGSLTDAMENLNINDTSSISTTTAATNKPKKRKVGFCFDERMLLHRDSKHVHQECPERAMSVYINLVLKELTNKLVRIQCEEAKEEDLLLVHTKEYIDKKLDEADVILPKRRHLYIETIYSHYKHTMHVEPLDETRKIIEEKCPEYLEFFDKKMKSRSGHMFNMCVMKKEILNEYCEWLFDILFELEKRFDPKQYSAFHARYLGRISERLLDVWIMKNNIKYTEVKVADMQ
jgi:hypothetical protein